MAGRSVRINVTIDEREFNKKLNLLIDQMVSSVRRASAEATSQAASNVELIVNQGAKKAKDDFTSILDLKNIAETAAKFSVYYLYYRTFGAIEQGVSEIIDYTLTMQTAAHQMEFIVGEAADEFLRAVEDFAIATPLVTQEVLNLAIQMKAFGFETQEVIPYLRLFGDAAAAVTGGGERMNAVLDRIAWAMAQIKQSAVLNAQDMRQLAQAGIPAWEYLAEYLNTDVATAMEMVRQRAVTSEEALKALAQGMERDFAGAMERSMKSVRGQWSVFWDSIKSIATDALIPIADFIAESILAPINEAVDKRRLIVREGAPGAVEYEQDIVDRFVREVTSALAQAYGMPEKKARVKFVEEVIRDLGYEFVRSVFGSRSIKAPSGESIYTGTDERFVEYFMKKLSPEDFYKGLKDYLAELEARRAELSRRLGEDFKTVDEWETKYKHQWQGNLFWRLQASAAKRRIEEYQRLGDVITRLRDVLEEFNEVFSNNVREQARWFAKFESKLKDVEVYGSWPVGMTAGKPVSMFKEALKSVFDFDRFEGIIADYHDMMARVREERIRDALSVLRETPVTQKDIWISRLEEQGVPGWDYVEKWDEAARRMKSVINEGLQSRWAFMVPETIRQQGDMAVRAWAAQWVEDFYTGLHPEAIDIDAAVQELTRRYQGEENLRRVADEIQKRAPWLPRHFITGELERKYGIELTDEFEEALRERDPVAVMTLIIQQGVEEHKEDIEKAGVTWFSIFFNALDKLSPPLLDGLIRKVAESLSQEVNLTGEVDAFQGIGGYAE